MEEMRPDSEQLLKRIQYEEKREQEKNRGKMKVFLGYAAGTGKTYAMLEAAHEAEKSGIDVVAGYIEPHNRPDTEALREGLEEIPPLMVDYKGIQLREFDLDAALKRRPQLLLVDELAHTNVRGCRNEKRYQDVMELLQAGISVYSTVNIQHLESLNDLVGSITGIQVRERIPDYVFDQADQVEVIDIGAGRSDPSYEGGKDIRREPGGTGALQFFPAGKAGGFTRDRLEAGRADRSAGWRRRKGVFPITRIIIQESISWSPLRPLHPVPK